QIEDFVDISYPIDTVVVVLSDKVDFEKIKKIDKRIVFSLPPVLFENEAKNIQKIVTALFKEGYRDFEANSFTGVEILSEFDCHKYLGYEFGLLNDIASDFFYNNGFLSVYPSIESDLSVFKSISSFNKGKVDCLMFCKPILFYSRVKEDFFKKNSLFSDKYTEISCVSENGINLFVSGKIFSLIGEKYKKEKIKFDNLTADLRYFENSKKILKDIFDDKVDLSKTTDFNISRKLR
ncbi:MAG TPA: hypothetical protein PLO89_06895, partial [Spirochaetota bacterium]|nr:hypothetical protein [Spirochaetota bacterium]